MFCIECGAKFSDLSKFCGECGKIRDGVVGNSEKRPVVPKPHDLAVLERPRSVEPATSSLGKKAGSVFVFVAAAVLVQIGLPQGCQNSEQNTAVYAASARAKDALMPDGFFGAQLLMSKDQVHKIRPNAKNLDNSRHDLAEMTNWEGVPAHVIYHFGDDGKTLLMITLNIHDQHAPSLFQQISVTLESKYGKFTPPVAKGSYTIYSEKIRGGVGIFHGIIPTPYGQVINQVVLYKSN